MTKDVSPKPSLMHWHKGKSVTQMLKSLNNIHEESSTGEFLLKYQ